LTRFVLDAGAVLELARSEAEQLQGDVFITLDARLAQSLEGVVETATLESLRSRRRT
jgi:hypothetical protein